MEIVYDRYIVYRKKSYMMWFIILSNCALKTHVVQCEYAPRNTY